VITGHFGRKTFRTRTRHFGTSAEVTGRFGTNFVVPKCLVTEVSGSGSVV